MLLNNTRRNAYEMRICSYEDDQGLFLVRDVDTARYLRRSQNQGLDKQITRRRRVDSTLHWAFWSQAVPSNGCAHIPLLKKSPVIYIVFVVKLFIKT